MNERIRSGVDLDLEAQANAILRQSFLDQPDPEAKSLILTEYMLQNRLKREVFVPGGTPDGAVRKGSFHRAINRQHPHLNATDGVARPQHRVPLKAEE
jgi:hypothetical protein